MTKGLIVQVPGVELISLCKDNATRLRKKAEQAAAIAAHIGRDTEMSYKVGDAESSAKRALGEAQEMEFIASHLTSNETYELSTGDLHKIGVINDRF